jgi:putative ABC transport system permease protein
MAQQLLRPRPRSGSVGTLFKDLRYGLRTLAKSPGFTTVALVTLGLGIGANTVIFSVLDAVLFKVLPYPRPEALVAIVENEKIAGNVSASWPDFLDWQKQNRVFDSIAAYRNNGMNLTGLDQPQRLRVLEATAGFWDITGAKPILGRVFTREEDQAGATPTVVLSYTFWQSRFGGDAGVVGRTVALNQTQYRVAGVLPAGFWVSSPRDVFVPLTPLAQEPEWAERGNHNGLWAVARLRRGVTIEKARVEMRTIARRLEEQYPKSNSGETDLVVPLRDRLVGDVRRMLYLLLACVGFVLLTACVNVANLMLARASGREKEMAVRAALGAGRARLIGQALTESLLLSVGGGIVGVVMALYATDPRMNPFLQATTNDIPRLSLAHVDLRVLAFVTLVSIFTGLFFGAIPALQMSRPDVIESVKQATRGATSGRSRTRWRSALLVTEVALALITVAGAGLMVRSIIRVQQAPVGFEPDHLLSVGISLPQSKYPKRENALAFFEQALQCIKSVPGVLSVASVECMPMAGGCWDSAYSLSDRPVPPQGQLPDADFNVVSADYFAAMGIPLIEGRGFTERDDVNSPSVAIINQTLARRMWPHGDPIGKRLKQGYPQSPDPPFEIVGVVGDAKRESLAAAQNPEVFLALKQRAGAYAVQAFLVRTGPGPASMAAAVEHEIGVLDPDQPLTDVQPMTAVMAESIAGRRISTGLLGIFAGVALLLAAVGVYGVMAYSVSLRTQEMGIRLALGARRRDLFRLMVGQGLKLAGIGVASGLAISLLVTRYMASLLVGVSSTDPLTFASVSLLLAAMAALASYIPAWRATRVDPIVALRYE